MRFVVVLGSLFALALTGVACGPDDADPPAEDGGTGSVDDGDDTGEAQTDDGADDDDASTGAEVDPDAPTFYGDVLPVVIENCAVCHQEGGIGPFALESYETARDLAEVIALQTSQRLMPPFTVDNSGECNTFVDARWLDQDQIDVFAAWAEAGAPEGDPTLAQPELPPIPTLEADDTTEFATPAGYQPIPDTTGTNGLDDYQCFLMDPGVGDQTRYLTGYEVAPGNPTVTHHLVGFLVDLEAEGGLFGTNGDIIQTLDEASPDQPGWDCYGGPGNAVIPIGTPITWAPGSGALEFPEGTGIPIPPGHGLVVQMHYNLAYGDGEDSTTIRLAWADEVEREAVMSGDDRFLAAGFNGGIEIPPGEESWVYSWDVPVSDFGSQVGGWDAVEVLGILPHMHEIGTRMVVELQTGGDTQCGAYVDRWDFDWQQTVLLEDPLVVAPSDRLMVTCEYDSTSRDNPTTPGLGSQNEMCAVGILLAEAP